MLFKWFRGRAYYYSDCSVGASTVYVLIRLFRGRTYAIQIVPWARILLFRLFRGGAVLFRLFRGPTYAIQMVPWARLCSVQIVPWAYICYSNGSVGAM